MNVYWLEQIETDVPLDDDWLSESEAVRLSALRFPKRRADWRLGRWTAKRAVSTYMGAQGRTLAVSDVELRSAQSGAAEAFISEQRAPCSISLSHRNGRALCVVGLPEGTLGCDLEAIEPRSNIFVGDYFTIAEQNLIACASEEERAGLVNLLWSAKESALKALKQGLRLDTRSVIVELDGAPLSAHLMRSQTSWNSLKVSCPGGLVLDGWWRRADDLVRTVVAAPSPSTPTRLRVATPARLLVQDRVDLDPEKLQAVRIEGTPVLPAVQFNSEN